MAESSAINLKQCNFVLSQCKFVLSVQISDSCYFEVFEKLKLLLIAYLIYQYNKQKCI